MISKLDVDIINSMSLLELDVLRYVDLNKKEIIGYSIQELSKKSFVSTATIMRFCKKLGFSGFAEFKYFLKEDLEEEEREENKPKLDYDMLLDSQLTSIRETASMLDKKLIEDLVTVMSTKKRIHFFAKGLTVPILDYAHKLLLTAGTDSAIYVDTHLAYIMAEHMDEEDLVIVASLSGNTHQVVRMAQIAKAHNATIVTITSNQVNQLSKIGDYNFGTAIKGQITHPKDLTSRLPLLLVLNLIISLYITKNNLG